MESSLKGIRVLDLSQFLSGPRCTQLLADMGAEVIKVEPPMGETLRILSMLVEGADRVLSILNRNKKAITLNIRNDKGRRIFKELVSEFDVLVENFTPGTMEKLGLHYEALKGINPGLIYAAVSGFGQTGPNRTKPAFDIIAQATGGIMQAYHQPDRPPGTFTGDLVSGAYAALGILSSIIYRQRSGKGQMVDISMQDVMFFHNYPAMSMLTIGEENREEMLASIGKTKDMLTMDVEKGVPFWHSYKAKDGFVAVVALTDGQWKRMLEVIDRSDLIEDERFSNALTRFLNADQFRPIMNEWTSQHTVEEIVKLLDESRVPCGPVMEAEQLVRDPHLEERGMFTDIKHPKYGRMRLPSTPIIMSRTPRRIEWPCPELGNHNREIYSELLGYTEEDISTWKREGII